MNGTQGRAGASHTGLSVGWTHGFWGDVQERTRMVTLPTMWQSLSDPTVSAGLRNFRIAAGLDPGEHSGPPFMDGDVYKWMEAAITQLETHPSTELAETVQMLAELIASVQRPDGYLHTPTLIAALGKVSASELADRFHFETYNLGHLITMCVRHHRLTGTGLLLDVAVRAAGYLENLAEHKPVELARSAICPSHYMAVIELHRATGDARWLRLAQSFLLVRDQFEGGDDNQDRLPVREQYVAAGHAVRANYLYAGLADLAIETGDTELIDVLERLWEDVVDTKLYVTGGCGALYDGASPDGHPWQEQISRVHQAYGRPYQLPHTTAHAESCANIGMLLWAERMLRLTGNARFADVIEQISFNVLLAGISLDGASYFYTNPLRQVRDLPFELRRAGDTGLHPVPAPPKSDERLRERYLSCFCCPPNTARTLARLHECAASASGLGLTVHLYGGLEVRGELEDGRVVALSERSTYPWDGRVEFTVTEVQSGGLPVRLRIPGWSSQATLTVAGEPWPVGSPGEYTTIDRPLDVGDVIVLDMPMPVRMLRAHRLAEETTNQVAVRRGPIVYCLESADLTDGVRLEQAAVRRGAAFRPIEAEVTGHSVIALETEVTVLPTSSEDALYDDLADTDLSSATARLVPYYTWGNRGAGEMSVWLPLVW